MSNVKNSVWRFFASVKLALISLFILAVVSIIGTLIKQGQPSTYYIQEYGFSMARFLEVLDFTDMYSSWWYITLFCLFATNLIVCSIDRLPRVWRMVKLDNLTIEPEKMGKMRFSCCKDSNLAHTAAAEWIQQCLIRAGWKNFQRQDRGEAILFFVQKGAWTRLSVYIVHLSVLIILCGGMIGAFLGFKAYVYLPEGRSVNNVFLQSNQEAIPLSFELHADRFEKIYYPSGMVKEYRSDLTVIDPKRGKPYQKRIVVNDPLNYGGLSFYQGDTYPLEEFYVYIRNQKNVLEQAFRVPKDRNVIWPGTDFIFRIAELKQDEEGAVHQARINFGTEGDPESSVFWIQDKETVTFLHLGEEFIISFRQLYTTLLLVIKDPGVWVVYLGCIFMVVGLAVSFYLSHQRIWFYITSKSGGGSSILVSGTSNKHRSAFERRFQDLVDCLGQVEEKLPVK